jgi:hypothetical protein
MAWMRARVFTDLNAGRDSLEFAHLLHLKAYRETRNRDRRDLCDSALFQRCWRGDRVLERTDRLAIETVTVHEGDDLHRPS